MLPGLLFGLGFGGFVDGIVLHEILQWHHMISGAQSSETLAGLELNVVADGFFHVVTWLLVMAGSIMTLVSWRQGRLAPTWSFHFGLLVAGWGFFNVVEGLIDHQLLGVHHVRDDLGAPLSWDIGFLVFGVHTDRCGVGALPPRFEEAGGLARDDPPVKRRAGIRSGCGGSRRVGAANGTCRRPARRTSGHPVHRRR